MRIEEYFGDWSNIIDLKEADRILKKLLASNTTICPQVKNIFRAFRLCSLRNLRVVVLGQDPYCDSGKATGIAFANSSATPENCYSSSLEILKESVINFTIPHGRINFDPSLEKWESQGVLLLNSALSCELNKSGSHALLWRPFIKSFLRNLSLNTTGIVYVLLGQYAQTFEDCIVSKYNYILKEKHPAWYARNKLRMPSDIWIETNKILTSLNGYGIKWVEEY